ncbi:Major Facilitator Superfamily protein [Paramicrobacterium humi]|uniref:Major Facilitator Superfamily protein n=2 Tax=Paramicrobacterium humi TaxID=640635 RepID=A0A1H4LPA3_9MICO|nr:MFS transporter [Microbacterium humi]SEB72451.1 Major Facilitator Superfamily protein [Microbacterium humi]
MSDSTPTGALELPPAQRWRAFAVCVTVAALTILDLTKVNVALPAIEHSLDASSTSLQLIVSGYILTFGLALVPAGRLGDFRSRKVFFIIGLTLFTVMSVACALAPTSDVLLVARLLQGVAAGIQMPQVIGLIQQMFHGRERGKAFGLFGAMIGVSTAFGPTIGGLLIALGGEQSGWRWIFWMNLPLGILALVLAAKFLPTTRGLAGKLSLDPLGTILFAVTVISLMWPFLFTTGTPADVPARWWLLVVFVLAAAAFIAWERRYAASGKHPLVPLDLFRVASFRNGTLLSTLYFSAIPGMFLLTTLYLQEGLGILPVYAGMVSIGFALVSAYTSWRSGTMVDTYGRPLVVVGLVVVLAGIAALIMSALFATPAATPWLMAGALVIAGAGGGVVVSPNQTLTLHEIRVSQGGLAGSVGQLGQRIGTAVGTAIGLALYYATIFAAGGRDTGIATYHQAYLRGMLAVTLLLALSLAVGVADMGRRRRTP